MLDGVCVCRLGGARPSTEVAVDYIDEYKERFGFEQICRILQVAPSTYCAAKIVPASARSVSDAATTTVIRGVHEDSCEISKVYVE